MKKKEIIKEFIESTSEWHKSLCEGINEKACVLCGIIPDKLLKLSKALATQRANLILEVEEGAEKMRICPYKVMSAGRCYWNLGGRCSHYWKNEHKDQMCIEVKALTDIKAFLKKIK